MNASVVLRGAGPADVPVVHRLIAANLEAGHLLPRTVEDVARIHVRSAAGEMVPIGAVARVDYVLGPSAIVRFNNYRAVTMNGSPAPGVASGEALAAMQELSATVLPPGYGYEWSGTALQEIEAAGQTTTVEFLPTP